MVIANELCPKCGSFVKRGETFCAQCGEEVVGREEPKFNWEPKDLPHPKSVSPATVSRVAQHVNRQQVTPVASRPQSNATATAGIIIIATLLAFSFWFGIAIGVFAGISPPEPERLDVGVFADPIYVEGNYFSGTRVFWSMLLAALATLFTWMAAMAIADQ